MATAATAKYVIRVENKTKRAFKAIGRSLNKVRKAVFSMKAGFIAAAGVAGLGYLIKRSMNATDEMAKMSRAIGVSVEELQALRHAAALGGLQSTQLDKAVQKLAINMADMSRGVGLAKDVFEKHNISVTEADGSLRSVMDVMSDVANVTAGMTNQTEKADLAYKLFGARGAKMINMLNGGSEAMQAAMNEAKELGLVMSTDTAKGVEDANDAITRLASFLNSSFTRAVAELAPAIEAITVSIMEWVNLKVKEGGGIGAIAQSMANAIIMATMSILQTLEDMGNGIINWSNKITKALGFSKTIAELEEEMRVLTLRRDAFFTGNNEELGFVDSLLNVKALAKSIFAGDDDAFLNQYNAMNVELKEMEVRLEKLKAIGENTNITAFDFSHLITSLDGTLKLIPQIEDGVTRVTDAVTDMSDVLDVVAEKPIWEKMKDGFESYFNSVKKGTLSMATITKGALMSAEDAIVNMMTGVKTNWKSLFRAILSDLIRLQLRKALLTAFGGFFAGGGRPPVGRPSIVGERGAELFVPDSAGTIIPNDQLGGKNSHTTAEINFNVQAIDASSFNSFLINNRDTIESIINNSILTNGTVRRTIQMAG